MFQMLLDASAPQGNLMQTLIMVGVAILFFYFILLRPEQKRRKLMEAQRSSMKVGDRVVAMNIVGTLDQIHDQTVTLRMQDGSKIEVLKIAITDVKSQD
jgi:preprotein translocase subunit YajC